MPNTTRRTANGSAAAAARMQVTNDAAVLKEDVAGLRDDLRTTIMDLRGFLTGRARKGIDKGQLLAKGAGKQLAGVRENVEGRVRARPLATIGIAFGAGVVAAMLSRRR